jgi:hypothetical protein
MKEMWDRNGSDMGYDPVLDNSFVPKLYLGTAVYSAA